tara:strand:+ start:1119 stop:2354 length:1236 start_codon:yes stop_codon:yes gene_type:complete
MRINVEGFTPYEAQREWIEKIENPEVKYASLIVARQTGKSLILTNLALKWSLENNGVTTMVVSPTYNQSRKIYEDIERVISGTKLLVSSNKSNYEMKLLNGSQIIFRSAEKPDNLRGYTNHYLLIDECAFIRESVWDEILKPTVLVHGRKVVFATTPKNKGTWIHKLYLYGLDEERPEYVSINGSSYLNPYIDKEELDEARRTMPENIFRAEVLGEFIDSGGEVFQDIEKNSVLDLWIPANSGKTFMAGLDVGRMLDYTVLTIMEDTGDIAYIYRANNKPWDTILNEVSVLLKKYDATTFMEVNGIGDPLFEQLKKKYRNIVPFVTTNASKQIIIEDLIYDLNTEQIKLPTEELFKPLHTELSNFTYKYSPSTRKIQYKAIDGMHDDCVLSLAICNHSRKENRRKGSYFLK